jgi:hypothetical protein
MKDKPQDDILDDKEYPIIRTLSLSLLEFFIVTFTVLSIAIVFVPLTYKILVTSPTPPTEGDKFGLLLLAIVTILKLIPFSFVLLFFRTSNNRYLDKTKAFKASYFSQLQQYSTYVASFYIAFGLLMSVLYGFSDYRTLYTGAMTLAGIVIFAYTQRTSVYV